MIPINTIELAEIRRAELIEQAARHRLARGAADSRHGRTPWRSGLWRELMALRTRMRASRRPDQITSTDLAPAAAESA